MPIATTRSTSKNAKKSPKPSPDAPIPFVVHPKIVAPTSFTEASINATNARRELTALARMAVHEPGALAPRIDIMSAIAKALGYAALVEKHLEVCASEMVDAAIGGAS